MILYESNEQTFTSNGFGSLDDCIDAYTTVEVNGVNELEIVYPVTGRRFFELQVERIITAETGKGKDPQPYRIYKISKPLNGKVTVSCQHLGYDIIGIPVAPFTATGISAAMAGVTDNAMIPHNFTIIPVGLNNTTSLYTQTAVKNMMDCLMGTNGSLLDVFHGSGLEYEFDKWTIKAKQNIGADNGVTIEYAKNMTALKAVEDTSKVYTGCVAYWTDGETNESISGAVQYASNYSSFAVQKIIPYNATSDFQEKPTTEDLNARAASYITDNNVGVPKITIDVSFVNLSDSPEYEHVANVTRVNLGDIVTVYHRDYDILYKAEVVKTVYDLKKQRYKTVTIGTKKGSINTAVQSAVRDAVQPQMKDIESQLSNAIASGTERIRGGLGGYVVINVNADGNPNEILIMDTDSIATATNVIRLNAEGIGFSTTGYDGTYRTAWTINGEFYAENITSGYLSADRIETGSLQAELLEVSAYNAIDEFLRKIKLDENGLHIATFDEDRNLTGDYQSLFTELGMRVINNNTNEASLVAEGDSVTAENFTANNFLIIDSGLYKSRFQKFSSDPSASPINDASQIGCFWIE